MAAAKGGIKQGDERPFTREEIRETLPRVPGWEVIEQDSVQRLQRTFEFPDFAQALAFTNQVGEIAEEEGHHPAILTEWGKVTVTWWTHKIGGLGPNDLAMAAKTSELYVVGE